jgi:hypothetical protein
MASFADAGLSSVLNVNCEIVNASRALISSLACYCLDVRQTEDISRMPRIS